MPAYRRWIIILTALLISTLVTGVVLPCISLWTPEWASSFPDVSKGAILATTTLNQVMSGLFAPVAGFLVGRIAIRTLMITGALCAGIGFLIIATSTAIWQVILVHAILLAVAVVLCGRLVTQTLAVRLFKERRGTAIAVVTLVAPLCSSIIPALVGVLLYHFNWRTVETGAAILVLALVPLLFFVIKETPAAAENDDAPEIIPMPTMTTRDVLSTRTFWGMLLVIVPTDLIFNAWYYNLGFVMADLGGTKADTTTLVSAIGFLAFPFVLSSGVLTDYIKPWPLLAGLTTVLVASCIVAAFPPSFAVLMVDLAVMGTCVGATFPVYAAIFARRYGPANFALATGLLAPIITLMAISPMAVGFAHDALGSYTLIYRALLIGLPLSFVGLYLLRGHTHQPVPPAAAAAAAA